MTKVAPIQSTRLYVPLKYLLRWRFEFSDGKAPKYGAWSKPGERPEEKACFVNKENLARAMVEKMSLENNKIEVVAECHGADFVNFEWLGCVSGFASLALKRGIIPRVHGLNLVTRNERVSVLIDGRVLYKNRHKGEENTHLVGFGK